MVRAAAAAPPASQPPSPAQSAARSPQPAAHSPQPTLQLPLLLVVPALQRGHHRLVQHVAGAGRKEPAAAACRHRDDHGARLLHGHAARPSAPSGCSHQQQTHLSAVSRRRSPQRLHRPACCSLARSGWLAAPPSPASWPGRRPRRCNRRRSRRAASWRTAAGAPATARAARHAPAVRRAPPRHQHPHWGVKTRHQSTSTTPPTTTPAATPRWRPAEHAALRAAAQCGAAPRRPQHQLPPCAPAAT
jgi:hypothetical protein